MKDLLPAVFCLACLGLNAQNQSALIKKYGIKKMVVTEHFDDPEITDKTTTTYYDAEGADTAEYHGDERYKYTQRTYDAKKRLTTAREYRSDGSLYLTSVLSYAADGSFVVKEVDNDYKLTSYRWYNKAGKLTKSKTPDGTVRSYVLDKWSNPVKQTTVPSTGKTTMATASLSTDKNGCVLKESWSDGRTLTYRYDERGLIVETVAEDKGNGELPASKITSKMAYE